MFASVCREKWLHAFYRCRRYVHRRRSSSPTIGTVGSMKNHIRSAAILFTGWMMVSGNSMAVEPADVRYTTEMVEVQRVRMRPEVTWEKVEQTVGRWNIFSVPATQTQWVPKVVWKPERYRTMMPINRIRSTGTTERMAYRAGRDGWRPRLDTDALKVR